MGVYQLTAATPPSWVGGMGLPIGSPCKWRWWDHRTPFGEPVSGWPLRGAKVGGVACSTSASHEDGVWSRIGIVRLGLCAESALVELVWCVKVAFVQLLDGALLGSGVTASGRR